MGRIEGRKERKGNKESEGERTVKEEGGEKSRRRGTGGG